ncbi:uncharacterized protein [Zea mays]|uniref:uncharacterized protein isoform X3 n=1 Tax=Zea mays TaxID=4577 RepID=UPI0004DE8974|nr:uncharacterized protein LOC103636080 isoform X3 [Zea mays]|eukprot:XP_008656659.1 uncharacterized protein LOC103636080 isoform X3 [Zea mays]
MASAAAATQVGTYFLRNYYNLLQQTPDVVHQFYSEASTMVRVDDLTGNNTATRSCRSAIAKPRAGDGAGTLLELMKQKRN